MLSLDSFHSLEPDFIMNSLERAGFFPTGEYIQLNSYENRVFDIQLESSRDSLTRDPRIIAKFYRPGRWSQQAIQDEHEFLHDLKQEGIEVACPLQQQGGVTLSEHSGLYLAVFPKVQGRSPQEFLGNELLQVGRTLARIHNVGSRKRASHRLNLDAENFGWTALELLQPLLAPEVSRRYTEAVTTILQCLEDYLEPESFIRIHGDCHKGNLLHRDQQFFFIDFDDFANGPPAQDLWMLIGVVNEETRPERDELLEGYSELRAFNPNDEALFEPLRGLRILHYASWIAKRWSDPSFPRLFPDFGSYGYWAEETEALERIAWSL